VDAHKSKVVPYVVEGNVYWPQLVTPYLQNRMVWSCPNFPRDTGIPTANASHYGINLDHVARSINGNPTPRALSVFRDTSTILFFACTEDAQYLRPIHGTPSFTAGFLRTYCMTEQAALSTTAAKYLATTGGIDYRHNRNRVASIVYLDGHVGTISKAELRANEGDVWGHDRWRP
jgi:prepilin-type processing-associated H-X9-DG protein